MEETIGYEALLSANEWDSLDFGELPDDFSPNDFSSPSGVTLDNGEGCAAPSPKVMPEGNNPSPDDDPIHLEFVHEVSCQTRYLDNGTSEYVLECDLCEEIGTADDYEEADVIAQQHRTVTSECWEVTR